MFLGMQDFDFAQITFPQISPQFCPNPNKFALIQPILPKIYLLWEDTAASPAPMALFQ